MTKAFSCELSRLPNRPQAAQTLQVACDRVAPGSKPDSGLNVVDLKLFNAVQWLDSSKVDHLPAAIVSGYAKLTGVYEVIRGHPIVKP